MPVRRRIAGSEDAAPPLNEVLQVPLNICSELQNLVSIAKFSAPLVFAEGKEYNNVALKIKYLYVHA